MSITHNFRQGTSYIRSKRRLLNVRYLLMLISMVNTTDMCLARILSNSHNTHNKACEFALTGDRLRDLIIVLCMPCVVFTNTHMRICKSERVLKHAYYNIVHVSMISWLWKRLKVPFFGVYRCELITGVQQRYMFVCVSTLKFSAKVVSWVINVWLDLNLHFLQTIRIIKRLPSYSNF